MTIFVNAKFLSQPITGVQRFAVEISRCLRKSQGDFVFLAPSNILHQDLARELNARVIGKYTGVIWEQFELPRFLKSQGEPLLLNLANVAPLHYRNQVVTIHDLGFYIHPQWYSFKFKAFYNFLIPRIARNSRKVITVSEFSKKEIIEQLGVDERKVEVIYNAVSCTFTQVANLPAAAPQDYILAVSSLDPRKNFKRLIKAFSGIKNREINLYIVGSENKVFADPEIKSLIVQNPKIKLLGYVIDEQLLQLYRQAQLFIYPSLYEGFGIPPLESMACGCPTIVSELDVMREIFSDASHYADPLSVADLTNSINAILHDSPYQEQLRAKGLNQVKKYSWQGSAAKVIHLLQELT